MIDNESDHDQTHTNLTLTPKTMVAHYRIVNKIGSGGMGEVYLAEDTKLKRKVALKFLSVNQPDNDVVLKSFMQEAQAAARLQHPNIITVHEVNEYERAPYIAMAYIEGGSLKELSQVKSFTVNDIIDIGIQVARGLAAAHEKGITHRDLKPGNIMVDGNGTVMILDFGLAILSDAEAKKDPASTVTSNPFANKIAGTILYMAPEQLLGQKINSLVDIFALGVILYELITKEHPFKAASISEISARILRDTPDCLSGKQLNVPYDLNRIISRCLNKKPDKRFQTARDVCNELEELSSDLKQDIALTVSDQGSVKLGPLLNEESFVLTTDLVRKLSHKDPKMIGSSMAYINNGVASDELILFAHGIGNDHRQFSDVLQRLPFRAISFSLFGFDQHAKLRTPITLQDHLILMHAMLKDVCSRLRPRHIVLVGFSSGADQILHFISSEKFNDIKVAGLLSLGCNVHFDDCFVTSKFAELTAGDEAQILSTIKEFGRNSSSLSNWLLVQDYLLTAFSKFGTQIETLIKYSNDILAPFEDGSLTQFPKWYKSLLQRVPSFQFIVDTDGYPALDRLMSQHLENNVLGDKFHEDTIIRVPISHMELGQAEMVVKHTMDLMKRLNDK